MWGLFLVWLPATIAIVLPCWELATPYPIYPGGKFLMDKTLTPMFWTSNKFWAQRDLKFANPYIQKLSASFSSSMGSTLPLDVGYLTIIWFSLEVFTGQTFWTCLKTYQWQTYPNPMCKLILIKKRIQIQKGPAKHPTQWIRGSLSLTKMWLTQTDSNWASILLS